MKRLLALALALAFLLPICLAAMTHSPQETGLSRDSQPISTTHQGHCPSDAPEILDCATGNQPILTFEQIAPRPDTRSLFGALPAGKPSTAQLPRSQISPAPDLQQLSITRT